MDLIEVSRYQQGIFDLHDAQLLASVLRVDGRIQVSRDIGVAREPSWMTMTFDRGIKTHLVD